MQRDEEAYSKLQQRILELETHLSDTKLLLDKEKAKYQSTCCRQEVSFAVKTTILPDINNYYLMVVDLVNAGKAAVLIRKS